MCFRVHRACIYVYVRVFAHVSVLVYVFVCDVCSADKLSFTEH